MSAELIAGGSNAEPAPGPDDIAFHRHTERRHMIRVKNALAAGLRVSPADPALILACTDYLDYVVSRFIDQGRANVARLMPRVAAAGDEEGARVVADIAQTLTATEAALVELRAGSAAGRNSGRLPELLKAADRFVVFYDAVLASRKYPAQQVIERHFSSEEYWALTNDVTGESIAREGALFEAVERLAPASDGP